MCVPEIAFVSAIIDFCCTFLFNNILRQYANALQIAAVGGNQRGRTFFKQHGWTELGSDKIEQKVTHVIILQITSVRLINPLQSILCNLQSFSPTPLSTCCSDNIHHAICCTCPVAHVSLQIKWDTTVNNFWCYDKSPQVTQLLFCLQYTSRAAQQYKQQLEKDVAKFDSAAYLSNLKGKASEPSNVTAAVTASDKEAVAANGSVSSRPSSQNGSSSNLAALQDDSSVEGAPASSTASVTSAQGTDLPEI